MKSTVWLRHGLWLMLSMGIFLTARAEDPALQYEEIFNDPEAQQIVRYGDIDNLGFGWPEGFDPFSGASTPSHPYPWEVSPDDADGTDRIMVVSSYAGSPPSGQDGYTSRTSRPENSPREIAIPFSEPDGTIQSAVLQIFVDDFQAPVWGASYQVFLNDIRVPELEIIINSLQQTGPIGKLITFEIPGYILESMHNNELRIFVDDPLTGAGDGFAFDFFRLLIDPDVLDNTGTINGNVYDRQTRQPIPGAFVSIGARNTNADSDGYYEIHDVPAGLVGVQADASGYAPELTTVDLVSDETVAQDFYLENDEADLSLVVTLVGEGQVESVPPGLSCNGDNCDGRFQVGTVFLNAAPADGWHFTGWAGACAGTEPNCSISVAGVQAAVAFFEPIALENQHLLDAIVVGNGTLASEDGGISCGDDCEEIYANDSQVILTATPAGDTTFIGWGGDCVAAGTDPTCQVTMDQARLAVAAFGESTMNRETTAWQVAEIYMATLGYAPDHEGLQYWVTNIDTLPQWTPETVAQSFFDQPLVQAQYPESAGYGAFIDALYRNIFGRGADSQGYDYWLEQLESGTVTRNQMIIALINGGWDNPSPDAQSDMLRFGHRVEVSLAFAEYQADHGIIYSQLNDDDKEYLRQVGADILLNVTQDAATRDAAIASIPTLLGPLH